jgi:hypothetical protein
MDGYGLAAADVQQCHFEIVRFDIDLVERHDGHQRRTRRDVVADLHRPLAHHAVDRRPYLRIGQIEPGLFKLSLVGLYRCLRRGSLGLEHVQLPACRLERRLGAIQRGLTLLQRAVGFLVFPHGAGARRGEIAVAARVRLRESKPGARRCNGGLFFFHDRRLARYGGVDLIELRPVAGDRRLGCSHGGLIVARVERCEHLSGLDELVVVDRHRGDLTGDARCDRGVMDHHISIGGPYVRVWPKNDVQHHRDEDRHDESDHNEGPARQRRGKLVCFLHLAVLRLSIPRFGLIVVVARRGRVWLFVPLRFGGPRLEFGYILCHAGSLVLCKMDARRHGADRQRHHQDHQAHGQGSEDQKGVTRR